MVPFLQLLVLLALSADAGRAVRGPSFVVSSAGCEALISPDGLAEIRILIDPEQAPDAGAYLGRGTFQAGAAIAEHVHERSVEMLYILSGEGMMMIESQALVVRAGDAVWIPRGARHSFRNSSGTALEAVQLYLPPGPERRFKAWPPGAPADVRHSEERPPGGGLGP